MRSGWFRLVVLAGCDPIATAPVRSRQTDSLWALVQSLDPGNLDAGTAMMESNVSLVTVLMLQNTEGIEEATV